MYIHPSGMQLNDARLVIMSVFSIHTILTCLQKSPFKVNTQTAQDREPWNRLNRKPTLASARREVYHFDPKAPDDSLDFVIKSQYDHHNQFLHGNNQTLVQTETVTDEHG